MFTAIRMRIMTTIGYLFYSVSGLFFIGLLIPIFAIIAPAPKLNRAFLDLNSYMFLKLLTRFFLPFIGIYKIYENVGFDNIKVRPAIIIGNHHGKLDGPLLLGQFPKTAPLMKIKYMRNPVYKACAKWLDFIPLDATTQKGLEYAITRAKSLLSKGQNLLIFPEGTRSSGDRLMQFKNMAFRISKETNTPIIPTVTYLSNQFMGKNLASYFPDRPIKIVMRCLDPVYPQKDETSDQLANRIRKLMVQELKSIIKTYS